MPVLTIDADAMFRAVTATGFKLLAYNLNLDNGEIVARTMRPEEIAEAPQGPSVKPLPKIGGDLAPKKDASPFGPVPVAAPKKKLFDDDAPKKPAFDSDFFKREETKPADPFGGGGYRRESGSKKLAEIFSPPSAPAKADPFARPEAAPESAPAKAAQPSLSPAQQAAAPEDPRHPRIPAASEAQQVEWMVQFARHCGDPEIRDELLGALRTARPIPSFERVLRKHQRTGQQWERYFRKQALAFGEAWLSTLGIAWELDDKP